MKVSKFYFILWLGLFLLIIVDGRRGGGSRGGGSRGSSSRGSSSRGSSSRTSSSQSSQSSRGTYERKTSKDSSSDSAPKVSQPAPKPANEPTQVKPSAPELKETKPSAPNLPHQNNQPAQNPNYRPDTSGNQQPPPYPGSNSNPNLGPAPPYPGGSGQNLGVPPPYPGPQARPPPYDTRPYPSGVGGNSAPYPRQPGSAPYPQQPGSAPYPQQPGSAPYPRQPGSAPYPQQPGSAPYPQQPGAGYPYPRQPGGAPYPQQPGAGYQQYPRQPGSYPQQPGAYPGYAPPPYIQNSGLPLGGNSYAKPYKKQGLLGQIFSGSKKQKTPKYGTGYGGNYGTYPGMSHSSNPMGIPKSMYPMMPLMMKAKKPKFSPSFGGSSFGRPSFIFLPLYSPFHSPFHSHHHYYHNHDIMSENYRGRCVKPFKPVNSTLNCETTVHGVTCNLTCNEGYHFKDNATFKENSCWHTSGVWRPSKALGECLPTCGDKFCLNGGKCATPGVCACDAEYRGDRCEHHILSCNLRKFAGEASHNISWTCSHTRNETICHVRCRSGRFPDEPQRRRFQCHITGEWTPNAIPDCISEGNSTIITSTPSQNGSEPLSTTEASSPKEETPTTTEILTTPAVIS